MTDRAPAFKPTWPKTGSPLERDTDLKRPGLVDPALVQRLNAGALPGPPARPDRRRRPR